MASDWDQRQLCPDGGCVGLIGNDGTCKVCGRAAQGWGEERARGLNADDADGTDDADGADDGDDADDADDGKDAAEIEAAAGTDDAGAAATDGEAGFEDRALCPDGGCIGVIGDDGACRVCGKRLDDSAAAEA